MPTKTEIAAKVLKKINALDVDESPTAKDAEITEAIVQSVYDKLKELGKIHWPLTDLPSHSEDAFIVYAGWHVQPDYGLNTIDIGRAASAERDLAALSANRYDTRNEPLVDF